MRLFGAIEAGGTKFVCAIGTASGELVAEVRIPTALPAETLTEVIAFFRAQVAQRGEALAAVGIGSFGPIALNPASPAYGRITSTPKIPWRYFDLAGSIRDALGVRVAFDTDVNAAALAESRWGAAKDKRTFLYVTVGTGIGGGAMVEGALLHGLTHPEMGHIRIPHDLARDPFPGLCPYHGDCLEGLASGPAIEARWKAPPKTLPDAHPAWDLEAHYLALAVVNWICSISPERIILGGGVMERICLFPAIRGGVRELLNGYVEDPAIVERIDEYIVPSPLGGKAGILGALALALL